MKKFVVAALAVVSLVLVGAGCAKSNPAPAAAPTPRDRAYPGTEPYVAPTTPPPGSAARPE